MQQQIVLHGDAGTLEADLHYEGPSSGATIRGARRGDPSFRTLPIPTELWGGVDSTTPFITHCFELFATQSVGPRLFVDSILAISRFRPASTMECAHSRLSMPQLSRTRAGVGSRLRMRGGLSWQSKSYG